MQKRHACLKRGQMGHKRKIHNLLHRRACKHCKAGLTAGHNIGMVAENGKRMSGQRTGAYMEYAGQQLAGDLIHVGDHQQQALAGSKGRGKSTAYQRAVHGAGCTGLGLHLRNSHGLPEQILASVSSPLISDLRHGRGRRNGVNGGNIAESISHMAGSGITVYGHFFSHLS